MTAEEIARSRTLRSQVPKLVVSFLVFAVIVFVVAVSVLAGVGSALSTSFVLTYVLIGLAVGCVAVSVTLYILFPKPLAEFWALGAVAPERRAAVRTAVWRGSPNDIGPAERLASVEFAELFVRNTPHRLAQQAFLAAAVVLGLGSQLFNDRWQWVSIGSLYGIAGLVIVSLYSRRRVVQSRGAAKFLAAGKGETL